ncbi:putative ABC transporter permease [Candidatus Saccharibacteria bacterium]|nr:putative ABC transporter permease [Candidatus Saccharibacteria bacterium]
MKSKTGGVKNRVRKKQSYREVFRKYLNGELKLLTYQKVGIILLIIVFSGFLGWMWECLLQEVSGGFQHLYVNGGNLLPWMNIYAYGAVAILVVSYKIRRHPWAVFVASMLVAGVVEYIGGWWAYTFYDGARYWDYSLSWWGVGNINGFICPASVITFGIGALAFMYLLLPFCVYLSVRMKKRAFLTFAIMLFTVVMVDDITNLTLKNLGLPTAMNLYENWGWWYS